MSKSVVQQGKRSMAWERRGKSLFYYQSRRTPDGKIVKEFVGRGDRAASVAADVENATARRQADAQALQEEQARLSSLESLTEELVAVTELLMVATLLASGYH